MHRIGLLLFDQVDLLDVGGPYEVFLTANRLVQRSGRDAPFDVVTVGLTTEPLRAHGGLVLTPGHDLDTVGHLDVVVVPGTIDVDTAAARAPLRTALRHLTDTTPLVTSVCTGSILLARAGVLDEVGAATTHHEDLDLLHAALGGRTTRAPWVDAGDVVTSGGLSNGLAMALHLVERLVDRELAVETATQIEYDWDPDDGVVVSAT